MRGVAAYYLDFAGHAEQKGVQRVTARGKQTAAPGVFLDVPPKLSIPGTDAVVIIDFAVVNRAEQAAVDDRFDGEKLTGKTALKADAGFHARGLHGIMDFQTVFPG